MLNSSTSESSSSSNDSFVCLPTPFFCCGIPAAPGFLAGPRVGGGWTAICSSSSSSKSSPSLDILSQFEFVGSNRQCALAEGRPKKAMGRRLGGSDASRSRNVTPLNHIIIMCERMTSNLTCRQDNVQDRDMHELSLGFLQLHYSIATRNLSTENPLSKNITISLTSF
ncbi:tetratricopeptide repeat protein [Striga asiatica]|uniref:Tetratricopeptide repeat protein n=1 Tax=Striga asiatica TaxID=4170 RepID=A0A5A7PNH7_STRAF|nr:tetratricopeptide repeat protein [Striga asiatica]